MKGLNEPCFYIKKEGYIDKYVDKLNYIWIQATGDGVVFLFEEFLEDIAFTYTDLFNWFSTFIT